MMTKRFFLDDIEEVAHILKEGGLVAIPTETVYGLSANGLSEQAVLDLYEVKGRPSQKPMSLMVSSEQEISNYCEDVPQAAFLLARHFWPGPLTLILKAKDNVPAIVRAGKQTVGLRCPDHPVTQALLQEADFPLAAPSANPSGASSPTDADMVLSYFNGRIAGVLDGGVSNLGLESTIIDLSAMPYQFLRIGALSEEMISCVLARGLKIIGITGASGSGKSTALDILKEYGALTLNCDAIYHDLLKKDMRLIAAISRRFPMAMVDGVLDRKRLGEYVFQNTSALRDLNQITHQYVIREIDRRISEFALHGGEVVAIDAVALIESRISIRCDTVIGVLAPEKQRISRIIMRDHISEEYAKKRISAQKSDAFFRQHCDHILENDADDTAFQTACHTLFRTILQKEIEAAAAYSE